MSFFGALRRTPAPAVPLEPAATKALTAPTGPVDPDASPASTPATPTPSRASEASALYEPRGSWRTAKFTDVQRLAEEYVLDDLAVITTALGSPLAAAQYLYAPHLMERPMPETTPEPLLDPDCRDGKCGSCVGGPCEHECHHAEIERDEHGPLSRSRLRREAIQAEHTPPDDTTEGEER